MPSLKHEPHPVKLILILTLTVLTSAVVHADKPTAVTLSPHLTELVYSAGGADQLIGVSAYSNYPEDATDKPVIGDAFRLDLEQLKVLNPAVIFYWPQGTANQVVMQLKDKGFRLVGIETQTLADIPKGITLISQILNTTPSADTQQFFNTLDHWRKQHIKPRSAMIQIADRPIYTVDRQHWMSEAIGVCGLRNVYESLGAPAAAVTLESVLLHNPEVIITTQAFDDNNSLADWSQIEAISQHNIITLEADHFTRPTLRLALAIDDLCTRLSRPNPADSRQSADDAHHALQ